MESRLYHHGIKGQKWGVKNGPPYPLDKNGKPTKSNSSTTSINRSKNINESIRKGKIRINNLPDYTVGSLTKFINNGNEYIS